MALNINGTTGISGVDGSVSAPALTGTDSNTGITFPSADTIKFATGGVERMAITNNGVSGITAGITMADEWRVTSNFTPNQASTVASNWERNDTVFSQIGTGMTESSGIFTFPQTGIYKITVFFGGYVTGGSGSSSYSGIQVRISEDSGSNYTSRCASYQSTTAGPTNPHFHATCHLILDVSNISTTRLKLIVDRNSTAVFFGSTNQNSTGIQFVRLGDT